ncbi:sn-glycerol-3-phosphate ABC transporter ATP-binding protein UgpC [Alginatibacterium sediminis]|uniref:sn-glycerol-3-phosphate ABC transporter ATP-binding protein UgpC n=1 Tax=Alginatibacterium sediminis TaxID=2164068 RepID=A0A420E6N7_9ALTE|nr:sn-glycerol-3-phosphate ABC transporter ATP-binding protein UgpC [Alginatibacterium sediminis]RKF13741.1 sn-glycerol-3-phosphate ABC transporter ATP-binding protein UgpC [Alginatibacterium sediminis]
MASISLKNIVKNYGKTSVVKNIDLEIEDGEFVVLVGPSGCGKSTTLRMIAGLEQASSGDIVIGDKVMNDIEPQHRNIAMVFQNYALYPHKSVRENIVFALRRLKVDEQELQRRLVEISEMLQLEELLDRKPADLSGGQRQRVAMGRAIIRDADVFLFDEPLSNLDAKLRGHMRTEIGKIHNKFGRTSVYVTHDQIEAMTLADKVVVLHDGYIAQAGTPMEIYLDPVNIFVAQFIGSPSMNIVDATLHNDYLQLGEHKLPRNKLSAVSFDDEIPSEGQPVKVGIRPDFFNDKKYFTQSDSSFIFEAMTIELVEPMGFDKEVLFNLAGASIKARLDLRSDVKRGEKLDLLIDLSRVLLFDTNSELRL